MTSVFVLQHTHSRDGGDEDVKLIGVYSSREAAEAAMRRLGNKPGFAHASVEFHIDEYSIDQEHWAEGYASSTEIAMLEVAAKHA